MSISLAIVWLSTSSSMSWEVAFVLSSFKSLVAWITLPSSSVAWTFLPSLKTIHLLLWDAVLYSKWPRWVPCACRVADISFLSWRCFSLFFYWTIIQLIVEVQLTLFCFSNCISFHWWYCSSAFWMSCLCIVTFSLSRTCFTVLSCACKVSHVLRSISAC